MSVQSLPFIDSISVPQSKHAERLLLPAAFITNAGSAFQITAAAILVFQAGQTTLSVGWLFIVVAIPQVLLSLLFGRLVDKVDRRMLSVVADLISAATAFALPLWLWLGQPITLGSYVANFLLACSATLFVPASSALVKERVRDDRLAVYNSRFEMAFNSGMLLASSLSGFLIIEFGPSVLFMFNALTFIVSAVLTAMIGPKPSASTVPAAAEHMSVVEQPDPAPPGAAVRAGRHAPILRLGFLYTSGMINLMVTNVILTALILDTFAQGAWLVGVVDALAGAGFILGAASYPWVSARISGLQLAVLCSILCAITIVLEPLWYIGLIIIHPVGAFCFANFRIAARTLLMQASPTDRVGRIFGGAQAFGLALGASATLGLSIVADRTSVPVAFFCLAGIIGGIAVWNYLSLVKPMSAEQLSLDAVADIENAAARPRTRHRRPTKRFPGRTTGRHAHVPGNKGRALTRPAVAVQSYSKTQQSPVRTTT